MNQFISVFSVISIMISLVVCNPVQAQDQDANSDDQGVQNIFAVPDSQNQDVGKMVSGEYEALYAYDDNGNWYFDLGDGREQGPAASVNELHEVTLTRCVYQVQYRGKFGDDPFLDTGWITNSINCKGYDDTGAYDYLIVHKTDSRYSGNKPPVFGDWEYHVLSKDGDMELLRPVNHVGK